MTFFWKYLAKKLAPYIEPPIEDTIQSVMYRATDAQLATDTLAEHLGYIVILEGGVARVEPLNQPDN